MTILEAIEVVHKRRKDEIRSGAGLYRPEEMMRLMEEIRQIQKHEVIQQFAELSVSDMQIGNDPKEAIAASITPVLRFGIDVGRLLQSANAGNPKAANEDSGERKNKVPAGDHPQTVSEVNALGIEMSKCLSGHRLIVVYNVAASILAGAMRTGGMSIEQAHDLIDFAWDNEGGLEVREVRPN